MEKEGEAGAGGGGTGAGSGSSRPPVPPMSLYERQAVQALQALQRQPNAAAQYLQQMYAAQHQQLMLQQHLSSSQLQNLAAVQQVTLAANRQTTSVSESGAATPSTVNLSTAVVTQAGLRTQVTTPPATSVLLTPPSPSLSPSQAKMYLQAQVVARTLTRTTPLTHQLILMPGGSVGSVQTELATGDTDQAQNLAVRGQGAAAKSSTVVVTQLTPAAVVPPPSPLSPPSTKAPPALNVDGEREEGGVKLTRSVTPSGHSLVSSASAYASLPPHSLLHQQLQQKHLVIQQQHLSLQRQTPAYPHSHQAHVPAHPHQSHPQTLVVQPLAQASAEASRPAPAHKLAQAHVEGLKQAQGQAEAYKQAQGQAETYKQAQGQAEAYKQAHGQTEAYKQAQGQTELYKQPQGQAEAYKQAQDQTEAHKQAQGQTEAHKLAQGQSEAYKQAQSQTEAYKQAQGQTQAQSEAHKQAHAHIESLKLAQAPAEVYKQAQPEAFKQAQAQAHPEGPKQAQSQAEVQKVAPAHAEAPHQALGQGEAQRQTTPHAEAQRQPQRKAETQRQGEEQGEAQRGEAGALGKGPAGKGTAPGPGTVLQASASTQTPGSGLAGAAHQWGQHCGQSGCGLSPLPLKSAVLGVKRKAEDEDSDSGFAALGPPELSPSLCPPLDPKHPQTGRGDSGLPPPVLTSVSSLLKGGGRHGVDNKPPRAIVKPHILTHVIEGFVIQEGAEPFPVDITNNKQKLQEPPVLQPETQLPQTEPGPQTGGPEGPELLTCEFCGRLEHADKFKRSKRFCSMACAKRYNVSCRKVVRRFTGERGGPNPKEGGPRLGRRSSRRESGDGGRGGSRRPGKGVDDGRVSDTSSFEDPLSPEVPPCQGETGGGGGSLESGFTGNSPSLWSVQQVHEFISTLPGCQDLAEDFQLQEIDGQALLLLKEEHLMTTMNMKLGPALKICARINLLKES